MLQAVPDYHPPEGIEAEYFSVSTRYNDLAWAVGVVAFHGVIPDGSRGREHAEFVKLSCLEAMARLNAICLVIDFRECRYGWGNSIELAFDALRRLYFYEWHDIGMNTPIKVIVSTRSAGFRSLLPANLLFDDMESAVEACIRDLEKWAED